MYRERCCQSCFAYVNANSRKCKYCGFKLKSTTDFLFDKIKQVLRIDRGYSVIKSKKQNVRKQLFTHQEIDNLLEMDRLSILMYLILSDLNFLDETSLIELGNTLMSFNDNDKLAGYETISGIEYNL